MSPLDDVTFSDAGIAFAAYPFPPAAVGCGGLLPWAAVQEVLPRAAPPEVWTHDGDILFVPAGQRDVLQDAAARRGIPCTARDDVWDLILEPFLDTSFDAAHQARTLALLAESGISPEECARLRREVEPVMLAYNFGTMLWDWTHLGLYDLLSAYQLCRVSEFDRRYRAAVAVARQARRCDPSPPM